MKTFALLSVLLLTQTVWEGLCQDPIPCPGSVSVTDAKTLSVPQGICNVLFKADKPQRVKLTFNDYKVTPPDYIFLFDGPSCLTNNFEIVTGAVTDYPSTAGEITLLSTFAVTQPSTVTFTAQPNADAAKYTYKMRQCGEELTADSGELVAEPKASTQSGPPFCVWNITTKSNKPTKLTVTTFDESDPDNQLWVFEGSDCSGKNLLWFKKYDASKNTVTSQTGKFVLMSLGKSSKKPFVAKWEKATTPGSSVSVKGSAFWLVFFVGAVRYLETA